MGSQRVRHDLVTEQQQQQQKKTKLDEVLFSVIFCSIAGVKKKKLFSSRFFDYSNNLTYIKHINRRKMNKILIDCIHGRHPGKLSNSPK